MDWQRHGGFREYNFERNEETSNGYYYYSSEVEFYNNYSLIISSKLESASVNFAGLYFSPKIVLNQKKSFFGVGLGIMLGRVK